MKATGHTMANNLASDHAMSRHAGQSSPAAPPLLSIIVATFNAEATLQRCLDSIYRQDFGEWELVVVDGASTDATVDLIRASAHRIAYWHSQPDRGIYDAWNQALDHARGEYVCFLGADDALHSPDTLARVFATIDGGEYDLVTGRGRLVNAAGKPFHPFGNPWDYHKVARRMTICHPGALHRRELFGQFGKFDSSYRISADYEFLLRLPVDLRTLHLDLVIADIADGGISRNHRWPMLRERFRAQAGCPRIGRARAAFNFLDKLWRIPVAKLLGIPN